ncbi:hypothetical protein [Moorena sp. SIO3A5]|uniref:hypothetical protein n=1 Tax=Moorena sp. SIO3A5 TaxID=2607822 RepID=UPI001424D341|nr:hypothetical protein [Moorena sp. SIO3A5]NES80768.1 hypothetical protein [Moorena sp. SIO2B7]
MEDLDKLFAEAISEYEKTANNGGTQTTHGSLLRRRVTPKPQSKKQNSKQSQ